MPITGSGSDTGEVRRYDVSTGSFDVFIPPNALGGPLGMPWYLTFGDTDPATLGYQGADSSAKTDTTVAPTTTRAESTLDLSPLAVSLFRTGPQASPAGALATPAVQSAAPAHLVEVQSVSNPATGQLRVADVVFAASAAIPHDDTAWLFAPLSFASPNAF
ncbi:MAG TPA: hypothetical protein VKE98_12410 [Gemmataceae bacterium]|nr:hypothetical protein [Gemmataceae bacterium]